MRRDEIGEHIPNLHPFKRRKLIDVLLDKSPPAAIGYLAPQIEHSIIA